MVDRWRILARTLLLCSGLLGGGLLSGTAMGAPTTFDDGVERFEKGDVVGAERVFESLAQQGHRAAAFNLGVLLHQRAGTDETLRAQARRWWRMAAHAGDVDAQWALAQSLAQPWRSAPSPASEAHSADATTAIGAASAAPTPVDAQRLQEARFWAERLAQAAVDQAEFAALRPIRDAAAELLSALPPLPLDEVRFEGGRFLFVPIVDARCVIALQGRIGPDATREFGTVLRKARDQGCTNPLVALESGGGSVADGLALGREIRLAGYSTLIARNCASACSLIFLGGVERVMVGTRARVGLHQAGRTRERAPGARPQPSDKECSTDRHSEVYRQIRRYLHFVMGDEGQAVFQRTMDTSCRSMDWLSPAEAMAMGMATRLQ